MNKDDFIKDIQYQNPKGLYIFEGDELYLKNLAIKFAIKKLINDDFKDLNINYLNNPNVNDILECANMSPLMSEIRLLVVNSFNLISTEKSDSVSEDGESFISFIDKIPKSTVIIILINGKCDLRKKTTKACKNYIISFDPLKGEECTRWIINEFTKAKKRISHTNAQKLQLAVGTDAMNLKSEIDKLIAYIGDKQGIDEDDINAICSLNPGFSVFNMTDALIVGNIKQAVIIQKNLLANGQSEYDLFPMLTRECRISYYIKSLIKEKVGYDQIIKLTGVQSFVVEKRIKTLGKIDIGKIYKAYEYCIFSDMKVKTGKLSQEGITERTLYGLYNILHN